MKAKKAAEKSDAQEGENDGSAEDKVEAVEDAVEETEPEVEFVAGTIVEISRSNQTVLTKEN